MREIKDHIVEGDLPVIEPGYCQCGCGQKTSLAKQTITSKGHIKGQPVHFLVGHRIRLNKKPWNYNGGTVNRSDGYVFVKQEGHPRADCNGYVFEHILVAEKTLGRFLPLNTEIHHYGKRHENNKIVICQNHKYHMLLHQRLRALRACGHAHWRKCCFCHKWDDIKKLNGISGRMYHKECENEKQRERHQRKRLARGVEGQTKP